MSEAQEKRRPLSGRLFDAVGPDLNCRVCNPTPGECTVTTGALEALLDKLDEAFVDRCTIARAVTEWRWHDDDTVLDAVVRLASQCREARAERDEAKADATSLRDSIDRHCERVRSDAIGFEPGAERVHTVEGMRDYTTSLRGVLEAVRRERDEARAERDKARTAASVFCGAHIGVPEERCPTCERDEARHEAATPLADRIMAAEDSELSEALDSAARWLDEGSASAHDDGVHDRAEYLASTAGRLRRAASVIRGEAEAEIDQLHAQADAASEAIAKIGELGSFLSEGRKAKALVLGFGEHVCDVARAEIEALDARLAWFEAEPSDHRGRAARLELLERIKEGQAKTIGEEMAKREEAEARVAELESEIEQLRASRSSVWSVAIDQEDRAEKAEDRIAKLEGAARSVDRARLGANLPGNLHAALCRLMTLVGPIDPKDVPFDEPANGTGGEEPSHPQAVIGTVRRAQGEDHGEPGTAALQRQIDELTARIDRLEGGRQ